MNLKVCELTNAPGTPSVSIFGMWQATHWLPGLPSLWCVCSSRVAVVRAVRRRWPVAIQAELIRGLSELRVVLRAVYVVAGSAGHAVPVHHALHEVVALHPVLVRGAVGEMSEIGLAQRDVFELPVVRKMKPDVVADGPVVGFAFDRVGERLALGMALDAGIVRGDVIHLRRIQNVGARGMRDVLTAGTVAAFAADIPFRDLLGVDVVVDGVAAVAGRAGGPLHVVGGIEGRPPVCAGVRDVILEPLLVADVPLHRQRVVVVANLREVALLPLAAVDESHLILRELRDVVRAEIGNDRVGMLSRIAHDVRHRRLLPALVNLRMTFLARLRADVVG